MRNGTLLMAVGFVALMVGGCDTSKDNGNGSNVPAQGEDVVSKEPAKDAPGNGQDDAEEASSKSVSPAIAPENAPPQPGKGEPGKAQDAREASSDPTSAANTRPKPATHQENQFRYMAMLKRLRPRDASSQSTLSMLVVFSVNLQDLYREEGWMDGDDDEFKPAVRKDLKYYTNTLATKIAKRDLGSPDYKYVAMMAFQAVVCHACKHSGIRPSETTYEAMLDDLLDRTNVAKKRTAAKGFSMSVHENFGIAANAFVCHLYQTRRNPKLENEYGSTVDALITAAPAGSLDEGVWIAAGKMVSGGN